MALPAIGAAAWWGIGIAATAIGGIVAYNLTDDDGLAADVVGDEGVSGALTSWLKHPLMWAVLGVGTIVILKK